MKKTGKFVRIVVGILAALFLIGSFPVKHYYGQQICDIMRVIGFVLMFLYTGMIVFASKEKK